MLGNNFKKAIRHAIVWLIWIGTTQTMVFVTRGEFFILRSLVFYLPNIAWFYFCSFVLFKNFFAIKKSRLPKLFFLVILFPVFHFFRVAMGQLIGNEITISLLVDREQIGLSLAYQMQYTIFAVGYAYFIYSLERQKRIQELELNNRQLEIQQLHTEYNFLKAQVNPHFLYNTLNTLFSHAQYYSEELADNILKLSEIMRYSIEGLDKDNGMVNLKQEVHHLQNLIDIHQLRFSNELQIDFAVSGPVGDFTIPPLVFITFVENALKYGELKNSSHPLIIRLDAYQDRIRFYCRNKKKKKVFEKSSGIGIQNVLKRLDVSYKGKYEVETNNEEEFYTLELTLYV